MKKKPLARVGDQGRGFGVVAESGKQFAAETRRLYQEIEQMLKLRKI
ncbi:MAG: hypothetical protein HGA76_09625 [Candidatus Firestonebacteria bacterium]|nr:hypothetical protein [Candidatus Firestonebacteria bacterium]